MSSQGSHPETCYMCDQLACSREHVPPRNLFSKRKDINGTDYRKNLITVPSCDAHNSEKSRDDEFLMVNLAGIIGNNSIGYRHKFGKVNRAIVRSSNRLLDRVFRQKRTYVIRGEGNAFFEVIWGTPDYERLEVCLDRVVRGLYLHHFRSRCSGKIKLLFGYLTHQDKNAANFARFIRDKVEIELAGAPRFGENPEIFFYQVTAADTFGLVTFRLCFYGGLHIFAVPIPEAVKLPPHLGLELASRGIKTIFTLGEKTYELN